MSGLARSMLIEAQSEKNARAASGIEALDRYLSERRLRAVDLVRLTDSGGGLAALEGDMALDALELREALGPRIMATREQVPDRRRAPRARRICLLRI